MSILWNFKHPTQKLIDCKQCGSFFPIWSHKKKKTKTQELRISLGPFFLFLLEYYKKIDAIITYFRYKIPIRSMQILISFVCSRSLHLHTHTKRETTTAKTKNTENLPWFRHTNGFCFLAVIVCLNDTNQLSKFYFHSQAFTWLFCGCERDSPGARACAYHSSENCYFSYDVIAKVKQRRRRRRKNYE